MQYLQYIDFDNDISVTLKANKSHGEFVDIEVEEIVFFGVACTTKELPLSVVKSALAVAEDWIDDRKWEVCC